MTNYCNIGPVEVEQSHIYDNNTISINGTEEFIITCTNQQAKQIMGLAGKTNKDTYNTTNLIKTQSTWGIVWIDTSNTLTDNDYISHKGWYLIHDAVPETDLGPERVHLKVTVEKLSSNEHEYFKMDYTPGVNDGTTIDGGYSDTTTVYALQDTFTTYASPTIWSATVKNGMTTGSFSASPSGYLCATGQSNSDGTWNGMFTSTVDELPYPSTFELDLQWSATPAQYSHWWSIYLTPTQPTTTSALTTNSIRLLVQVAHGGVSYYLYKYSSSGAKTTLKSNVSLGTNKTPKFKFTVAEGNIYIYADKTAGGTYTKIYNNSLSSLGVSWLASGFYATYEFQNKDSTSATCYSSFCYDYYDSNNVYNNIVTLPCTTPITTADFTRESADGDIPCYVNPVTDLFFWQDSQNFYDGSVKGYNSNYANSTPQIITWTDEVLDPDSFYVTNGLIKLTTNSSNIVLSCWNGSDYTTVQTFTLEDSINLIKPLYLSTEKQIYQINSTKWAMFRGKPFINVEHPYDDIGYTLKTNYYHDGEITTNPSADADITMEDISYSLAFDIYNLFTQNQFDLETGAATGWSATGGTLSIPTPGAFGNYALKCVTNNSVAGEGIVTSISYYRALPVTPAVGLPILFRPYIKGTGTVKLYVIERDSGGSLLAQTKSDVITLNSTYTSRAVVHEIQDEDAVYVSAKVLTDVQQSAEIYIDQNYLAPYPDASLTASLAGSGAPVASKRYGLIITKKDPCTIKSDSIPASSLTGLCAYDQMQPGTGYNGYYSLAMEYMKQTSQKINIRRL